MPERYLIDTDVLVEYFRGSDEAIQYLEGLDGELYLSAISVAELYSGVRGKQEEQALEQFLLAFEIIGINEQLAKQGGIYRRLVGPSHGTRLGDALISACADEVNSILVTFNQRHYPMIERVHIPYGRA
jgi:predicted nucleic acid-binding protein